ncbi:MAG: porphobilinogen synthase [Xanthobacteraceae bacterium]|nr:porphobilinogen synthase [Xanthobacteraceae bacterium]
MTVLSRIIAGETPLRRMHRLRRTASLRGLVRETALSPRDFILPLFVKHGSNAKDEIPSMPGVFQWSADRLAREIDAIAELNIPAVLLFGLPAQKDETGTENFADNGIVQQAIREIKKVAPDIVVMTDVCMCEYTDHGHCGLIRNGVVENDETLEIFGRVAVSHAAAGADVVAPSGMMDGQVKAIRVSLDKAGFKDTAILGYSAKYSSALYGPFRVAADSAPAFGDRRAYQMDPANAREAMREIETDIGEGADMVMIKPALSYLDIVRQTRDRFDVPIAAYNVSGEYAMVKAAGRNGWIDERAVTLELLTGIKRAGADLLITYHAKDAALWLQQG